MRRITAIAAAALLAPPAIAVPSDQAIEALVPGVRREVRLGPNPTRFGLDAPGDAELVVWAASDDVDPALSIVSESGAGEWRDDDGGGGTTALVFIPTKGDARFTLTIDQWKSPSEGSVIVHAWILPNLSPDDRREADAAFALLREASESFHYDLETALAKLRRSVAGFIAIGDRRVTRGLIEDTRECLNLLFLLQDIETSKRLIESLLRWREKFLPPQHPDLYALRSDLATAIERLGRLDEALRLREEVVRGYERIVADDDENLQLARYNWAISLASHEEVDLAVEQVDEILGFWRERPDDDPWIIRVRALLARLHYRRGDLESARAEYAAVLPVVAALEGSDASLISLRTQVGAILTRMGEMQEGYRLLKRAHEGALRLYPDGHPVRFDTLQNLVAATSRIGDMNSALLLGEQLVADLSRARGPNDRNLLAARLNLGNRMVVLGREEALPLLREVFETVQRVSPRNDVEVEHARMAYGTALCSAGDFEAARDCFAKACAGFESLLPEPHELLIGARSNLGNVLRILGRYEEAAEVEAAALASLRRSVPEDDPRLQYALANLAATRALLGQDDEAIELILDCARSMRLELAKTGAMTSPREVEARAADMIEATAASLLSTAVDMETTRRAELDAELFGLFESIRGAAFRSAALRRAVTGYGDARDALEAVRAAAEALTRLVTSGADPEAITTATRTRDDAYRDLFARLQGTSAGIDFVNDVTPVSIARTLDADEACVSIWRYHHHSWDDGRVIEIRYLAMVLRADASVALVPLGPADAVDDSVRKWRDAIGAATERGDERGITTRRVRSKPDRDAERAAAAELARLVVEPFLAAIGDAARVTLSLDGSLLLAPIDALALDGDRDGRLGDRVELHVRSTAWERLLPEPPPAPHDLAVLLGDVDYGDAETEAPPATGRRRTGFVYPALPATRREIDAIQALIGDAAEVEVLSGAGATRAALESLCDRARYVHLATHGYFAPDSLSAWRDQTPIDARLGLGRRTSIREQAAGLSPLVMCGVALANANLPADEMGHAPGILTAEEIAALDLSACELAVLSACDTHIGLLSAGQGMASLQKAFHMAGARTVVSSLWRVSDDATRELMTAFYRRLIDDGLSTRRALWEAKRELRQRKAEDGEPAFAVHDWAGWVVTGD